MRMSKLFSQTLKSTPADLEADSHKLLLRAGFIRQHAAGIFSYLPLARRSMRKIEQIMKEEIEGHWWSGSYHAGGPTSRIMAGDWAMVHNWQ